MSKVGRSYDWIWEDDVGDPWVGDAEERAEFRRRVNDYYAKLKDMEGVEIQVGGTPFFNVDIHDCLSGRVSREELLLSQSWWSMSWKTRKVAALIMARRAGQNATAHFLAFWNRAFGRNKVQ